MRGLAAAALPLVLAGCGSGSRVVAGSVPRVRPPQITLETRAGSQRAVQGSSCVQGNGAGICADTAYPAPRRLSVVRPGERVRVRVAGATSIDLEVHRFGCHAEALRHVDLDADGRWRVDLPRGAYELVALARLGNGDTSGGVGMWVDPKRPLAVVPADALRTLCP